MSHSSLSQIACRSASVPAAGVYLVRPISSASCAAVRMYWGVTKSGSPAQKETTSRPLAAISLAFASIARVGDGEIALHTRESSRDKPNYSFGLKNT